MLDMSNPCYNMQKMSEMVLEKPFRVIETLWIFSRIFVLGCGFLPCTQSLKHTIFDLKDMEHYFISSSVWTNTFCNSSTNLKFDLGKLLTG